MLSYSMQVCMMQQLVKKASVLMTNLGIAMQLHC